MFALDLWRFGFEIHRNNFWGFQGKKRSYSTQRKHKRPLFPIWSRQPRGPAFPSESSIGECWHESCVISLFQLPHNHLPHAGLPSISQHLSTLLLASNTAMLLQCLPMFCIITYFNSDLCCVYEQWTNADFSFLLQQSYVSSGHQMAPPSPNTNSSSNSSGGGGEQLSKTNLYIRGLHPGTTDQDLVKLCQPWVA